MYELGLWKKTNLPPTQAHISNHMESAARQYNINHSHCHSKSVIYTCITNQYDDINEIATPGYINPDWDYVCFTDDKSLIEERKIGVWSIRPLAYSASDPTRNNRWHKMHPHYLFPEHNESIYIDANVDILTDWLFKEIKSRDCELLIPQHPTRDCIYEEYKVVFSFFLDNPSRLRAGLNAIKKSGMPKHYGLTENNVIYRRHNLEPIIAIMSEWWTFIQNYSKRDQLSLAWLLWKHSIIPERISFSNPRFNPSNFCVFSHQAQR